MTKARSIKEENTLPQLQDLAKGIISGGIISGGIRGELSLHQELQKSSDLTSTYISLDKAFEHHHIENNLSKLREEKGQAKTAHEAIGVIAKEQEFLSSLHNNLKYPEVYANELLDSIKQAKEGKDTIMQDLHQVTSHILNHQVMSQEDLLKNLQSDKDTHFLSTELTKISKDHYSNIVGNNIKLILNNNDKPVKIGQHKFDCPIKYLEHEIKNPAHAYADIARFKKNIHFVQEHVHKLELAKEMNKSMGGMSM